MPAPTSRQEQIDYRRMQVARMRLRGLTMREVVRALHKVSIVNPDTRQPYSLGTVHSDCKHMAREWQAEAAAEVKVHKGRILAELREVRRKGWQQENMKVVLQGLKQEATLLGLDSLEIHHARDVEEFQRLVLEAIREADEETQKAIIAKLQELQHDGLAR